MTTSEIELGLLVPAFLTGLLVVSTHVPMGQQVLARGIIFIDLAIAQIAGLGVIAAHSFGWEPHGWEVQVAAVTAALIGAVVLNWTERHWARMQEALIGVLFVLAASGGILLLSNNPHGGEHLKELLVGQILWVDRADLVPVAILYVIVLVFWYGLGRRLGGAGFYVLFSIIVTASVQLVGVYLVFASLIIPAVATARVKSNWQLPVAYAIGIAGYALGLVLSAMFDLPTGAVIIMTLALVGACVFTGFTAGTADQISEEG
ncbi:MAG: zinc/manganese transporter permease [Latescibacteria bacterium DG_63]|nr:MAG: zinc/manganese transporter permease [Latescibacteria bacterium DG_63]